MSVSPTSEGFLIAFRRPSLSFAEIAWRWTYGATAIALSVFSLIEYFETLPVNNADLALLATRQPAIVGRALVHILRGSRNRTVLAGCVAVFALALLWVFAAAIGRFITLTALFDLSRGETSLNRIGTAHPLRTVIKLNCLRAVIFLAMLLSIVGAAIVSNFVSTPKNPHPGFSILLFVALGAIAFAAGGAVNWWLSLAAIFAIGKRAAVLDAVTSAVTFSRTCPGAILAVTIWTALVRAVAFSVAGSAAFSALAFIAIAPRVVFAAVVLVTLVYFAVVDWLCVARLAGYVGIAEGPDNFRKTPFLQFHMDRDQPLPRDRARFAPSIAKT